MSELELTPEQRDAVERRSGPLFLHAGAGSGKTRVLVERFVRAVREDGVPVEAILAITFTEKAAAELGTRVRERFVKLGEREHARAAEAAFISTIHGFCARLLRSHPLAAGIDPEFRVLAEPEAARLSLDAFDRALEDFLADGTEPGRLDLAAAYTPDKLRKMTAAVHGRLRSRGERNPVLPEVKAPLDEGQRARLEAALADAQRALGTLDASGPVGTALEKLERCREALGRVAEGTWGDPEEWEGLKFRPAKSVADALGDFPDAHAAWLDACAQQRAYSDYVLLRQLLELYGVRYAELKAGRSALDFDDLELIARDLLEADPGLREQTTSRFTHVMVDEFQDTNPLQRKLLELITRDNLFTVGDENQSIYLFRDADVKGFVDRRHAAEQAGHAARLSTNFRSAPELLTLFNAVFGELWGEEYVRLHAPEAGGRRPEAGSRVELLLADSGRSRDWGADPPFGSSLKRATAWRAAEARLLARRLSELVGPGQRFGYGDAAVLVRAGTDLWCYERALQEQGIPTYVVGGRGYWEHQQVSDIRAWLAALANPLDDLSLYTVLGSPLVGASLDSLAVLSRHAHGIGRNPWWTLEDFAEGLEELLPEADRAPLAEFVRTFREERAGAARASLETLIDRAVTRTGYDRRILAMPQGARRMANVRKLMRLAREYERDEGRDLRGFIDFVDEQELVLARQAEAPLEGEGLDAVRLMTIHAAKGLEFPLVAVADLGRSGRGDDDALRVTDDGRVGLRVASLGGGTSETGDVAAIKAEQNRETEDEEHRVFYVAMTRAQEHLVLSGATDLAKWPEHRELGPPIAWIWRALAPNLKDGDTDGPVPSRVELLTPENVDELLPARAPVPPTSAEEPPEAEPPAFAALEARRPAPVSRLSYSALSSFKACGYRFYAERVLGLPRPDRSELGPPPKPRAASVEEASGQWALAPGEEPSPAVPSGLSALDRGSVVHELLERTDFAKPAVPPAEEVRELLDARSLEATEQDVERVREFVLAFVESELCRRLARSHRPRRELQFLFTLDTLLVNGVMDVHAMEGTTALVVDYKTDPVGPDGPGPVAERDYSVQRLVYALAALKAGAERVEVVHLFLDRPADPAVAVYEASALTDLEEQLRAVSSDLVNWNFEPTDDPHRELCLTCAARPGLCSWDSDRTLSDRASTVAG